MRDYLVMVSPRHFPSLFFYFGHNYSCNKAKWCFSMLNKQLTWPALHLVHKLRRNIVGVPHQTGCTCRLVVVLKELHDLGNFYQFANKSIKKPYPRNIYVFVESGKLYIHFLHQEWGFGLCI